MDNNIYLRVKSLCEQRHIAIRTLEISLGFGMSTIKKWSESSPSVDKIIKVADYFGVSTDYLLGATDIQSPVKELINNEDIISFQRAHEKMSEGDRERMMQMLKLGFAQAFSENNEDK